MKYNPSAYPRRQDAWLEESVHWIDCWSEIPEALNSELGAVFGEFLAGLGEPV